MCAAVLLVSTSRDPAHPGLAKMCVKYTSNQVNFRKWSGPLPKAKDALVFSSLPRACG